MATVLSEGAAEPGRVVIPDGFCDGCNRIHRGQQQVLRPIHPKTTQHQGKGHTVGFANDGTGPGDGTAQVLGQIREDYRHVIVEIEPGVEHGSAITNRGTFLGTADGLGETIGESRQHRGPPCLQGRIPDRQTPPGLLPGGPLG